MKRKGNSESRRTSSWSIQQHVDIIESENCPELERLAKQHADKLAELKTKLRR